MRRLGCTTEFERLRERELELFEMWLAGWMTDAEYKRSCREMTAKFALEEGRQAA